MLMNKEEVDALLIREGNGKEFKYKGYDCEIIRNTNDGFGHLCGYITIYQDNQNNKLEYPEIKINGNIVNVNEIQCHGGITFHKKLDDGGDMIGFDCAHYGDFMPFNQFNFTELAVENEIYCTMEFVESEIKSIIDMFEAKQQEDK